MFLLNFDSVWTLAPFSLITVRETKLFLSLTAILFTKNCNFCNFFRNFWGPLTATPPPAVCHYVIHFCDSLALFKSNTCIICPATVKFLVLRLAVRSTAAPGP